MTRQLHPLGLGRETFRRPVRRRPGLELPLFIIIALGILILVAIAVICFAAYKISAESFEFRRRSGS